VDNDKFPYVNHMNVLFESMQLIDIQALVEKCTDEWYNQTLCQVNDSVVRLGILHGEYHWHKHVKRMNSSSYWRESCILILSA